MKNLKTVTAYFILVCLVVIFGYDAYVYIVGGEQTTISWAIITASYKTPFIPFCAGVICGHLFWRMPSADKTIGRG